MARPGFSTSGKFARLAQLIGDELQARGLVEFLWERGYEHADDFIGDEVDVEIACHWHGEPGKAFKALMNAGGPQREGLIEADPDRPGGYRIHDFWEHAPNYVADRAKRSADRKQRGIELSAIRSRSGRKGAESRWGKGKVDDQVPPDDGNCMAPASTPRSYPFLGKEEDRDHDHDRAATAGQPQVPGDEVKPDGEDLISRGTALLKAWNKRSPPLPLMPRILKRDRENLHLALQGHAQEELVDCIDRAARSEFANGKNTKGWRIRWSWFLRPGNLEKILGGDIDDWRQAPDRQLAMASKQARQRPCPARGCDEVGESGEVWGAALCAAHAQEAAGDPQGWVKAHVDLTVTALTESQATAEVERRQLLKQTRDRVG